MINKIIAELKKDSDLKGIEINNKNCSEFYKYITERDFCKACRSLDDCKNSNCGYQPFISNSLIPAVIYKKCDYLKKALIPNNINNLFMKKSDESTSFKNFRTDTIERQKIYNYALTFINEYKRGSGQKGLFINGEFGVGKTYFLLALSQELAQKNIKNSIVFFPDLSRSLKSAINTNNLENIVEELKNVEVLLIDDLGGEMSSAWLRDEIILPILNHRQQEGLPIFITSNLSLEQLVEHFASNKDNVDNMKASRIVSRIKDLTFITNLSNDNYRKK